MQQSSAWSPLLSISCHRDAQTFLCSLFAPVCIEQAIQATIYPCRSLCESVKQSCEAPMLAYNYPWPSIFNCSQFPEDNGFCIKPSQHQAIPKFTPQPISKQVHVTPMTTPSRPSEPVEVQSQNCHACSSSNFRLEDVVSAYCRSRIALRGRVQAFEPSSFDIETNRRKISKTQVLSKHLVIPRRERRFLKGGRIVFGTSGAFMTEINLQNYFMGRSEVRFTTRKELDFYVLSDYHLNLMKMRRKKVQKRADINGGTCGCEELEHDTSGRRYLFTANVVRVKKESVKRQSSVKRNYIKRLVYGRSAASRKMMLRRKFRLVYVTGVFAWNRVRPFVDWLENRDIDKSGMCQDVSKTVREITTADARFF